MTCGWAFGYASVQVVRELDAVCGDCVWIKFVLAIAATLFAAAVVLVLRPAGGAYVEPPPLQFRCRLLLWPSGGRSALRSSSSDRCACCLARPTGAEVCRFGRRVRHHFGRMSSNAISTLVSER